MQYTFDSKDNKIKRETSTCPSLFQPIHKAKGFVQYISPVNGSKFQSYDINKIDIFYNFLMRGSKFN